MRLIEKLPIVSNAGFNTPGLELLGLKADLFERSGPWEECQSLPPADDG